MSEGNPYATPRANLELEHCITGQFELHEPRSVSAGRGSAWLAEGYSYFKQSPGAWILTCIVGFALTMLLSLIPLVSLVTSFLYYVWLAGLMIGLKAQFDGEKFEVKYLFSGFNDKLGSLVLLAVIMMLTSTVVMFAVVGTAYFQLIGIGGSPEALTPEEIMPIILNMLIGSALLLPLMMACWFAPALIVLHDVGIIQSLKMSFMGCLKNTLPFLVYGILGLLLMIAGSIPLGLGLLIVTPMFFGSIFASYRDIFVSVD